MAVREELKLPSMEELDISKDINLGTASLIAAGNQMGRFCEKQNDVSYLFS